MSCLAIDDAVEHFAEKGWIVVDVLPDSTRALLSTWVDEVAALPESTGGLQRREQTDTGPRLCRSEQFVDVHAEMRALARGCSAHPTR